jgi:hypothetical protein
VVRREVEVEVVGLVEVTEGFDDGLRLRQGTEPRPQGGLAAAARKASPRSTTVRLRATLPPSVRRTIRPFSHCPQKTRESAKRKKTERIASISGIHETPESEIQ